jgi:hypothetical protein
MSLNRALKSTTVVSCFERADGLDAQAVLDESAKITKQMLRAMHADDDTRDLIIGTKLCDFYQQLADLLLNPTQLGIEHQKNRGRKKQPAKKFKVSAQSDSDELEYEPLDIDSVPPVDHSSSPISVDPPATPQRKRVVSGGSDASSYNIPSGGPTPTKAIKPEPHTQMLQDSLMKNLTTAVWKGKMKVEYARNRDMFLKYTPYPCPPASHH